MEIGISMFGDIRFDHGQNKFSSTQQRLQDLLEEIKLADEAGLDVFGIGEHHRPDYASSSPEVILAAASTITKNIKLASAVTVLSSDDPVRVYEHFATLDLISGGRAEVTIGRGSFIESFPLFGYDLNDYDELFSEKTELLLKINENKVIDWRGKFRPALHQQEIYPRAFNNHLNIWIAVGGTPESVVRAARFGIPMIFAIIGGAPRQFKPYFDLYREEYALAGHDANALQLGTHSHGLVSDEGASFMNRIYPLYAEQMNRVGKSRGWPPFSRNQFDSGCTREGAYFYGGINEITEKILYHQEMFGLTRWVMHCDVGAPDHKDIMKGIEILGAKVAPAVKKALHEP